jgi:aminoglycoside 6'-N-acetyltransferase I
MQITDLDTNNELIITQIAQMLVDAFREHWPDAWPTLEDAIKEVRESFELDRITRVAIDDQGNALGWIGGISQYDGNVWELHPLVVRPDLQGKGIGRALVADLENQVRERGGLTLILGSDDQDNMTTLSDVDLYSNLPERIANIRNLRRHPYEFYQKLGFVIVGVVPDANGLGKPDIIMAKRLVPMS